MSWITTGLCEFFSDMIGSAIEYFGEFINNIFYSVVDLNNENVYVNGAFKFMIAAALALIVLLSIKQVFSTYVMETDNDSDADPFELVVRIAQTVAVITCSGEIFNITLKISKEFASDLIGSTSDSVSLVRKTQELLSIPPGEMGGRLFAFILVLLITVGTFLVFTFISVMRGAEIIAMKIMLPVFALDLLGTRRERWNNFFTGYMIAFFSYGIQILFYTIAMKSFVSSNWNKPEYMLGTIGFLILAIKSPKFLEKFLYVSGVSQAASGGIRMLLQGIVFRSMK